MTTASSTASYSACTEGIVKLTENSSIDPQDAGLQPVANPPCWASETAASLNLTIPFFVACEEQADRQLRGRRVFEKPTRNDPVYNVVQRLFAANTPYSLSRSKEKEQKKALRLAWRRFLLGYPPRKATDTSIGDAVNWEWIVNCTKQANANVVIVSRDSDYGVHLKGDGLPAPWQDILDLAYYSGWRKQEILGLTWEEIDMAGGVIRLSP